VRDGPPARRPAGGRFRQEADRLVEVAPAGQGAPRRRGNSRSFGPVRTRRTSVSASAYLPCPIHASRAGPSPPGLPGPARARPLRATTPPRRTAPPRVRPALIASGSPLRSLKTAWTTGPDQGTATLGGAVRRGGVRGSKRRARAGPGDPEVTAPRSRRRGLDRGDTPRRRRSSGLRRTGPERPGIPRPLGAALAGRGDLDEAIRLLAKAPGRWSSSWGGPSRTTGPATLTRPMRARAVGRWSLPRPRRGAHRAGHGADDQGRHVEALGGVRGGALKIDPVYAPARLARGPAPAQRWAIFVPWPELDWRLNLPRLHPRSRPSDRPGRQGAAGKTLLLVAEPGLGDQLMFVRFAAC